MNTDEALEAIFELDQQAVERELEGKMPFTKAMTKKRDAACKVVTDGWAVEEVAE